MGMLSETSAAIHSRRWGRVANSLRSGGAEQSEQSASRGWGAASRRRSDRRFLLEGQPGWNARKSVSITFTHRGYLKWVPSSMHDDVRAALRLQQVQLGAPWA